MASRARPAPCEHCRREVVTKLEPMTIGAHVILTVFTLGIWIPLWLVGPRICVECGSRIEDTGDLPLPPEAILPGYPCSNDETAGRAARKDR